MHKWFFSFSFIDLMNTTQRDTNSHHSCKTFAIKSLARTWSLSCREKRVESSVRREALYAPALKRGTRLQEIQTEAE